MVAAGLSKGNQSFNAFVEHPLPIQGRKALSKLTAGSKKLVVLRSFECPVAPAKKGFMHVNSDDSRCEAMSVEGHITKNGSGITYAEAGVCPLTEALSLQFRLKTSRSKQYASWNERLLCRAVRKRCCQLLNTFHQNQCRAPISTTVTHYQKLIPPHFSSICEQDWSSAGPYRQ